MINVLIGNVLSLIASLLMIYCGLLKENKKIIYIQSVEKILTVLSNIVLGGITGAITSGISFVRNILCYKDRLKIKQKLIIILLISFFSLYYNNLGVIGLIPVIATIVYTLFMDTKDIIKFKILTISTSWFIYDLYIMAYTAAVFEFLQIITNSIAIYQLVKLKENKK